MAEQIENNPSALANMIVQLTNDYWSNTKRALLLARVGQALSKKGFALKSILRGQKLALFIQYELKGNVEILTSPQDPLIQGLVPAGESRGQDISALFAPPPQIAGTQDWVSFDRRLWAAFSHPISPGYARTLRLEPEINFEDIPAEQTNGKLVIPSDLIIPVGIMPKEQRNTALKKNILDWFSNQKLDIALGKARRSDKSTWESGQDSVLSLMLSALEVSDRKRIVLPLDIVQKLLNKKARQG